MNEITARRVTNLQRIFKGKRKEGLGGIICPVHLRPSRHACHAGIFSPHEQGVRKGKMADRSSELLRLARELARGSSPQKRRASSRAKRRLNGNHPIP